MTDMEEKLREDIMDALYWDNRINASNIVVHVKANEAVLSGTVSYYTALRIAEVDALDVPGIHSVKNELTIQPAPSAPSDSDIQSMLYKIYLWNRVIDQSRIHLEVDKGIVTLKGTVTSLWEKARAEDLVDDVIGVIGVINDLAVVPTEDYADEMIAKRVVSALEKNVLIEADSVHVKVEKGRVVLRGSVRNGYALERAGDIALITAGATSVENLITLK